MSNIFAPEASGWDNGGVIIGDMGLGDRILEARKASGLTQAQVADAIGTSPQAVSAWETGTAKQIEGDKLFRLADLLRVSARWLATGEQVGAVSQTAAAELMADLAELSTEKQRIVTNLVKSLRGT